MSFKDHKTKIICTIGPASNNENTMRLLMQNGMDIARLNLAHGDFDVHSQNVSRLRKTASELGCHITCLADLPGPKMRVGRLKNDVAELKCGEPLIITSEHMVGDSKRIPISFAGLPDVVATGDTIYLNDGFIQLRVEEALSKTDVLCTVIVGGVLRSNKGINVPGIDLGLKALTEFDKKCIAFAVANNIDAISISFVQTAWDVMETRQFCKQLGYHPFIIAKIERSQAIDGISEILQQTDGIMIARGDLGVEIPIEEIALAQKHLITQANIMGKPVITATQMLESMTENSRPTRAEVTDVANAILDGTDCIMLSEETAMGKYPVESVSMLSKIAQKTEKERRFHPVRQALIATIQTGSADVKDIMAMNVQVAAERLGLSAIVTPTITGSTPQRVSRLRLDTWIIALSLNEQTYKKLHFFYGVFPIMLANKPASWIEAALEYVREKGIPNGFVALTHGPSLDTSNGHLRHKNYGIEIIDLH